MRIANLISTIKAINNAVVIPVHDSWHLSPPIIKSSLIQTNRSNQPPTINLGDAKSGFRPIIDSEDKAWSAIKSVSDHRPEWVDEVTLGT